MKIGVMGTGGVGGYFGSLLARAGEDIHFIARGRHRQMMEEEGLRVVTGENSFQVMVHTTSDAYEIGPVDLVLFAVKSYDTEEAARQIAPMVDDDTMILSLQNGIDNVERLAERYGPERILGGTAYVEATNVSPGVIVHTGKPGRIVFGETMGKRTARAERLLQVFLNAGIQADLSDDIIQSLWSKFIFICGVHGVSTLSRASLGLVLSCPETRELMVGVMREVETLARHRGVSLPEQVLAETVALAESYHAKFKCSLLHDLEWRQPMEIESFNGLVVRMGKEAGLDTPLNQAIYACLRLQNQRILDPLWASKLED